MSKTFISEACGPMNYEDASVGRNGTPILGKLHAPFFDLSKATRNGRDYTEAAEDALKSDTFKEKMNTRTFFGRLGHPCNEDEMNEDPAVRACVILTDVNRNNKTNMVEGTLEIINNKYGQQLKSLIDAGCIMGVSTRGSGDSRTGRDGTEIIERGTYDFECLDVVSLPAIKEARCSFTESLSKKGSAKKLESIINDTEDKSVLEAVRVTVESTDLKNKKELLESIDKKLSASDNTGTIVESFVKDIEALSKRLAEVEERSKSDTRRGTTIEESEVGSKSLKESLNTINELKSEISRLTEDYSKLKKRVENFNQICSDELKRRKELKSMNESLTSQLRNAQAKLQESEKARTSAQERVKKLTEENRRLQESVDASKKTMTESVSKNSREISKLKEGYRSVCEENSTMKVKFIESMARSYGVRLNDLKSRVNKNSTPDEIESAAKSIREDYDARHEFDSDITRYGVPVTESVGSLDDDPETSRAGRVAALTNRHQ